MKSNQKMNNNLKNISVKVMSDNGKIRFTIPAEELRKINAKTNGYVKVNVKKYNNEIDFYTRVPSISPSRTNLQAKKNIPKNFVKETNLQAGDFVDLTISLVDNKRSIQLVKDNKLDILAAIPEKTNSGRVIMVDLFKKHNEEYCRVWYCSGQGGNAKSIELRRYICIDRPLGELFGLMQAESRKNGYKFDFTNNLVSEHKLFMDISERFGISKNLWKYQIFYNPDMSEEKTKKQITIFEENLSINNKLIFTESKTLSKVALTIYIDCNILAKIMISLMLRLRSRISSSIDSSELNEFAIGFICKDLLGDGTVTYLEAHSKTDIVISEEDIDSQKDISQILTHLEIKSNVVKNKIHLQTNLESYLWFLENKAFEGHRNRKKLISIILNNYYIENLYSRLKKDVPVTALEFSKEHNLLLSTSKMFLRRNSVRGPLYFDRDKKSNVYKLSNKGQKFIKIIKSAKKELITL